MPNSLGFYGDARFPEGMPLSLGNVTRGCQIPWDARFPVTPATPLLYAHANTMTSDEHSIVTVFTQYTYYILNLFSTYLFNYTALVISIHYNCDFSAVELEYHVVTIHVASLDSCIYSKAIEFGIHSLISQ